jgi:hypothetical protein
MPDILVIGSYLSVSPTRQRAMHFAIPTTEEVYEDPVNRKNQHTTYQIHLNGGYLCSVRYKRLFDFNEQVHAFPQAQPHLNHPLAQERV